jgi:hypothetical protein
VNPLLCAKGSAFLMRCLRTLFDEETVLLSVRKFPFPELTRNMSTTLFTTDRRNAYTKGPGNSSALRAPDYTTLHNVGITLNPAVLSQIFPKGISNTASII